jgi:hypothetical protein
LDFKTEANDSSAKNASRTGSVKGAALACCAWAAAVEGEADGDGSGAVVAVVVVVVVLVVVAVFAGAVFSVWLVQPAAINTHAKARPRLAALKNIFILMTPLQ